jgi:hypothetical protein
MSDMAHFIISPFSYKRKKIKNIKIVEINTNITFIGYDHDDNRLQGQFEPLWSRIMAEGRPNSYYHFAIRIPNARDS